MPVEAYEERLRAVEAALMRVWIECQGTEKLSLETMRLIVEALTPAIAEGESWDLNAG